MITTAINHYCAPRKGEEAQEKMVPYLARKVMGPALDVLILLAAINSLQIAASIKSPVAFGLGYGLGFTQVGFGMYQLDMLPD